MQKATLNATDLCSKFGFGDGDVLMYFFANIEFDEEVHGDTLNGLENTVLVHLVRKHLLPLLPGVSTYEISSIHNPIRAEEYCHELLNRTYTNVSVAVSETDVLTAKAEVLARFGAGK